MKAVTLRPKKVKSRNEILCECSFSIHHEAREGHDEEAAGLERRPKFDRLFSFFVLFVTVVVIDAGQCINSVRPCTSLAETVFE